MGANAITLFKKNDIDLTFTISEDGSAVDVTGQTILFTIKSRPGGSGTDADALITKTATLTTPASGIVTVSLTDTDTDIQPGTYYYDLKRIDGTNQISYEYDTATVSQTVTQRDS